MDDDERMEPVTFDVDTLDALAKILRGGSRLTCNAEGFYLLDGPGDYSGAGGPTVAAAVAGYTETVLHGRALRRAQQKGPDEWRSIVREPSGVRCHQLISDGDHLATIEEGDGTFTVYMAFGESPGVSTTLVAAKHLAESTFAAREQQRLD